MSGFATHAHSCQVRCTEAAPSSSLQATKCSNCNRLAFDCRWQSPEPGEQYVPPPKRRRTFIDSDSGTGEGHALSLPDGLAGGQVQAGSDLNVEAGPHSNGDLIPMESSPVLDDGLDFFGAAGDLGWVPGLDFITPMLSYDFPPLDDLQFESTPVASGSGADSNEPPLGQRVADSTMVDTNEVNTPFVDGDNRHLIQHYLEVRV